MSDPRQAAGSAWRGALALYLQPRLLIVFVMGFASGLPLALSSATLSFWLAESGVALTAIGLFALVGTPYNVKFLWAPFIDRVNLPLLTRALGRRRSWMLLIQLGLMLAIVLLGFSKPAYTPMLTAICALAVAFFSASQDIVIDAYRIEILDAEEQGAGAAMTQAGYRLGAIVAGAGALFLAEQIDWSLVYAIMAALVLVGMAAALLAPDPARRSPQTAGDPGTVGLRAMVVDPFVEFFQRNGASTAIVILAFILLYKFGDAYAGVMAYPFYYEMGFSKSEVATVSKLFGVAATVVGVFVGGLIVKRFGIMPSLLGCGVLQMLSNLMYAAQSLVGHDVQFLYFTIGIENLSGGMGSSAFVAYLSVLCNTRYTGTQFALFTSFMAFGRTLLSASSGWVVEITGWFQFFVISTLVALPGLLLLLWMLRNLPINRQTGTVVTGQTAAGD
ncbi:MAG: AmpG family muropeptide MFS transporter [Gammaproteobacteria bacterium]|nr:AmpG family muropeptide MFS transporter [Gammaproteobacteria bacterium]